MLRDMRNHVAQKIENRTTACPSNTIPENILKTNEISMFN
jgi:hypothetical protein